MSCDHEWQYEEHENLKQSLFLRFNCMYCHDSDGFQIWDKHLVRIDQSGDKDEANGHTVGEGK